MVAAAQPPSIEEQGISKVIMFLMEKITARLVVFARNTHLKWGLLRHQQQQQLRLKKPSHHS